MSTESEVRSDILELKLAPMSPSIQSDLSTDGDGSTNHTNSLSNDKFSPLTIVTDTGSEPKAKKRRKQSNPLKIHNAASPKMDVPPEEVDFEKLDMEEPKINHEAFETELINSINDKNKSVEFVSQKNSLSRVTNALYNNKMREANKVNKFAIKSKESSLQSLTDISSPESNDEVGSNNENKNLVQNAYPQMPPLLPICSSDLANEASKMLSTYSFPDFPSPMQQGNISLTMSNRSFITSSGVRVFNPEAYCELCEKEFCNKYFLKTHKANKHGICSVDNSPGNYSYRAPYKSMHMNPQIAQQMITQMCENGATFGSADSYCNICQKYFCNKYFLKKHRQNIHGIQETQDSSIIPSSIHVPVISSPLPIARSQSLESKMDENSSNIVSKDEDSKINVSLENIKNNLNGSFSSFNGSSPIVSSKIKNMVSVNKEKKIEKYLCELCNIEFCDKYYLDAHKQNKHGAPKSLGSDFLEFSDVGKVESIDKSNEDSDELKESFKGQMCAPCMKNFTSADTFQNHMLEVHGAMIKDEDENSRTSDVTFKRNGQLHFDRDAKLGDLSSHYPQSLKKSPVIQEMENSNGSSDSGFICNICFAKYKDKTSLIVHMETDHSFQDSTSLLKETELQCDSCPEQFSNHLLLISHRLKAHGIITPGFGTQNENIENDILRRMDGEYSLYLGNQQKGSSPRNFCQICNKELCNKYFMKTHMMKMHGIDMDKIPIERSSSGTSGVYCDICQKYLCSKYFLKAHKQNVHGILDDTQKLPTSPSSYISLAINEKKIERLSGNYSQVMKLNNTLMNDSGVSKEEVLKRNNTGVFSCDICGQEFLSKLLLQVHLVNKHVKCNESKTVPSVVASAYSQMMEDSKETVKSGILPCSCCSYINLEDSTNGNKSCSGDTRMVSCLICSISYHHSDYYNHHLSHGSMLMPRKKDGSLENGSEEQINDINHSGNISPDLSGKNRMCPRKFKRFRCSKCDKTFRTKIRCLHHIQVMHKSKKGLMNQNDQSSSKKISVASFGPKLSQEQKSEPSGMENGLSSIQLREAEDGCLLPNSEFQQPSLPVPYVLPRNSDVIMQPFHLSEPKPEGATKQDMFVPSLVYLPVSQKISEPVTVAFTLTPA